MPYFTHMPQTPISEGLRTGQMDWLPPVPLIEDDQPFSEVVRELSQSVILNSKASFTLSERSRDYSQSAYGSLIRPCSNLFKVLCRRYRSPPHFRAASYSFGGKHSQAPRRIPF